MNMRLLPAVALLALGPALVGCGTGNAADDGIASAADAVTVKPVVSTSVSPVPTLDRREAQLKFAQCMREHGVDVPDPGPGGGIRITARKGDQGTVEKAMKECEHFMKAADGGEGGPRNDPEAQDRLVKFAQCMREHGIDLPDPVDGRLHLRMEKADEGKFAKAQEACKEFDPGIGAGVGGPRK